MILLSLFARRKVKFSSVFGILLFHIFIRLAAQGRSASLCNNSESLTSSPSLWNCFRYHRIQGSWSPGGILDIGRRRSVILHLLRSLPLISLRLGYFTVSNFRPLVPFVHYPHAVIISWFYAGEFVTIKFSNVTSPPSPAIGSSSVCALNRLIDTQPPTHKRFYSMASRKLRKWKIIPGAKAA